MHAPPSGPKSGHTNPSTQLSQDLLEGREALTYRPGFSSKTQPWLQTPLPVVQSYTSLCASPSLPPTAGSAPLSQMNAQYSSQAVVSSVLPWYKEQRNGAQKGALLFASTTALRKALAQSLRLSWPDHTRLLYGDTVTASTKSFKKTSYQPPESLPGMCSSFQSFLSWPHTGSFMRLAKKVHIQFGCHN